MLFVLALATIQFDPPVNYFVGERPDGVTYGNFSGDANIDIAVSVENPDRVAFLVGNGNGGFTLSGSVLTGGGSGPGDLISGKFTNSNNDDIAVILKNLNRVAILKNLGGGSFTMVANTNVGTRPVKIAKGDLNNNGLLDLVTVNRDSNNVSVLLNNGNETFSVTNYSIGADPRGVALGDFNKDGFLDIVATNHDDRSISVLFNNGNGTFGNRTDYSVGSQVRPDGVTSGDFDKDGDIDIAVATSGNNFNFVSIFMNNGSGVFSGPFNYNVNGTNPSSIVAADFDIDGYLDLATSNQDSNNVSLLPNLGNGTFGAPTVLGAGTRPGNMASADLDKDGDMDVFVSNRDSNDVSVYINTIPAPIVFPSNFTIIRGSLESGGLTDLFESDDMKLVIQRPRTPSLGNTQIILEFEGTSSIISASSFSFTLEANSSLTGATQNIYLFDYQSNSLELVDSRTATTTDSEVVVTFTANASRFIDPNTGKMLTRVVWTKSGFVPANWKTSTDVAVWTIKP
jgi:hypothetical protein